MVKEIFGIELEIPLKDGVTCDQFRECMASAIGVDLVHFTRNNGTVGYHSSEYENNIDKWRVASDSSLHGFRGRGVEIVSRRRTTLSETKKVMNATRHLVDLDLMTRTTCGGHHVHIGVLHFSAIKRSYDPENRDDMVKLTRTKRVKLMEIKIHEIYAYFQPVINAIVSRSRRTGNRSAYNRGVSPHYLEAKDNPMGDSGIYKTDYVNNRVQAAPLWGNRGVVNFGALDRYGTVEFRQHQQTYNVATVQNWVKLMHRLTSRSWVQETKNIDPSDYPVSIDGFADFLGLGANRLRAWMRRRANHFGFPQLAREEGVNPSIGVRVRNGEPLPNREQQSTNRSADNGNLLGRLYDDIVLACANDSDTYDAIYNQLRFGNITVEELQDICAEIPSDQLPEHNFRDWNALNWGCLRIEVMENFTIEEEDLVEQQ